MSLSAFCEKEFAMNPNLFSSIKLGRNELKNRILMAPLTRSRAGRGNVPQVLNALYYAQRASAGLIISEATQVSPEAQGYISTPGIHTAEQVEGWKRVTTAVHLAGGRIFLQLWHVGRISHPSFQPNGAPPVAPSAIKADGQTYTAEGFQPLLTPRALGTAEIPGIVADFRQAALNAIEACFDGVEIHGANGYLIDQFLRDKTNKRTDQYGGSIENRSRFLLEVVDAVVEAVRADRTALRISPQNTYNDIDDSNAQALFNYVATSLSGKGLAYLHVLEGDLTGKPAPSFDYVTIKNLFGGHYIANNGYDKARAHTAIAEGKVDAVAFGKPFIANPDLVIRFLLDAPVSQIDQATLYGGTEKGYTDYPFLMGVSDSASLSTMNRMDSCPAERSDQV
jgi:N-ethylmaleimide reductase